MKKYFAVTFLLAACVPSTPMRMDHSMMNGGMMQGPSVTQRRADLNVANLPEAQPSQILEVNDGDVIDLNPQMATLTTLDPETAEPSPSFAIYAYNGQFPGPLLKVKQGSMFTVRVKNEIDQPTTVHWHGIRLENRFDGAAGVTQDPIEPGDSFIYTVTVPDEGMFWYHPHVREDVQQDLGLYGGLWVTPKDEAVYEPVHQEEVVILDDILLDQNRLPVPHGKNEATYALMGRFGNTYVTNGIVKTRFDVGPFWDVPQGTVMRFAFLNAANTRTFRIGFHHIDSDRMLQMQLVSGDNGRYAEEHLTEAVTLSPSERAIIEVLFDKPGQYNLLQMVPGETPVTLGIINGALSDTVPGGITFGAPQVQSDVVADIASFRPYFTKAVNETIHLSVVQKMMGGMQGGMMHGNAAVDGIEWEDPMPMMNAIATKANTEWKLIDESSEAENMDINYQWKVGDKVKIRIINDTEKDGSDHPMQHPIHFHGQRFLVLSVDGKPNENLVWKDTVLVPKDATVDVLLDMTNPGDWMVHCHIAEHLSNGMMGQYQVTP